MGAAGGREASAFLGIRREKESRLENTWERLLKYASFVPSSPLPLPHSYLSPLGDELQPVYFAFSRMSEDVKLQRNLKTLVLDRSDRLWPCVMLPLSMYCECARHWQRGDLHAGQIMHKTKWVWL